MEFEPDYSGSEGNKRVADEMISTDEAGPSETDASPMSDSQLLDSSLFGFSEINASKLVFKFGIEAKVAEWKQAAKSPLPNVRNACTQVQLQKPRGTKREPVGNVGATTLGGVYPNVSIAMPVAHALFPVVTPISAEGGIVRKKIKMGVVWFTAIPLGVRKKATDGYVTEAVYKDVSYECYSASGEVDTATIKVSDNLEPLAYDQIKALASAWSYVSRSRLALTHLTFNVHYQQGGQPGAEIRYGLHEPIAGWSYSAALLAVFGFCPAHVPISGVVHGAGDSIDFEKGSEALTSFFNDLPAKAQGMSNPLPTGYGRPLLIACGALEDTIKKIFQNHKSFGMNGGNELVPLDIPRYLATGALNAPGVVYASASGPRVRNPVPFLSANNLNSIYAFQYLLATNMKSDLDVAVVFKATQDTAALLKTERAQVITKAGTKFGFSFTTPETTLAGIKAMVGPSKAVSSANKIALLLHGAYRYPTADEKLLQDPSALVPFTGRQQTASYFTGEPVLLKLTIARSSDQPLLNKCITLAKETKIANTSEANPTALGQETKRKQAKEQGLFDS